MTVSREWTSIFLCLPLICLAGCQHDAKPVDTTASPASIDTLIQEAFAALQQGDTQTASAAADAIMNQNPDEPQIIRTAGDIYLRAGQYETATKLFNLYVKEETDQLPYLWQRGISLYFSGDYDAGAKQFEAHRTVNPHDVENAAWHFLCVAKAKSPDEARRQLLPAPDDPRVPMEQILALLSDGDTNAVKARVELEKNGTVGRRDAEFHGDFYLGLYADALGDNKQATEHMERSAKDAPRNYMGDVARVYAEFLRDN